MLGIFSNLSFGYTRNTIGYDIKYIKDWKETQFEYDTVMNVLPLYVQYVQIIVRGSPVLKAKDSGFLPNCTNWKLSYLNQSHLWSSLLSNT